MALLKAKLEFARTANAVNPLEPVTGRPVRTLAMAFAAGFILNYFRSPLKIAPLLPVIGQVCGLLTRLVPLYKRARGSGG